MTEKLVSLAVEGRQIVAPSSCSITQAVLYAGYTLVEGIGCMGQGVCGSCRVMLRRADSREVSMVLGCETLIEEGMQVDFLNFLASDTDHPYQIEQFRDTWQVIEQVNQVFPEAAHCRHCGGCDSVCPKEIQVQRGVNLTVAGHLVTAGDLFEQCIMCNLCTVACPEHIAPNHLGLLVRRLNASLTLRPANLMLRLQQMSQGELQIEDEALNSLEGE